MTHPPTECDRAKIFEDKGKGEPIKITPEDINNALSWYWINSSSIWASLPMTTEGATITHWWQLDLEQRVIPAWRSGRFSQGLAVAYIYAALKRLFRGLRERASP